MFEFKSRSIWIQNITTRNNWELVKRNKKRVSRKNNSNWSKWQFKLAIKPINIRADLLKINLRRINKWFVGKYQQFEYKYKRVFWEESEPIIRSLKIKRRIEWYK